MFIILLYSNLDDMSATNLNTFTMRQFWREAARAGVPKVTVQPLLVQEFLQSFLRQTGPLGAAITGVL